MKKTRYTKVTIGDFTLPYLYGSTEEIAELSTLVEEVADKFFGGDQLKLVAELASVFQKSILEHKRAVCSGIIDVIQEWSDQRPAAIELAEQLFKKHDRELPLDEIDYDLPDEAAGFAMTSCNDSHIDTIRKRHTFYDPDLIKKSEAH